MSADPRVSTGAGLARLGAQIEGIGRELGQLRKDLAADLARVDDRLDRLTEQVTQTNGRVRAHDMKLQEIEIRADERSRAQAEALHRADRRWTRIAWAAGTAVTVALAITGWVLAVTGAL